MSVITSFLLLLCAVSTLCWIYLTVYHGGYWLGGHKLSKPGKGLEIWPRIAVIIPARDEADSIGDSLKTHLQSDYPGHMDIFVIDDDSQDNTAYVAEKTAKDMAVAEMENRSCSVLKTKELPPGWTGKLWAMNAGVERAQAHNPDYYLFTDADILHAPETLRCLTEKARTENLALVSLMAMLDAESKWGQLLIPAFVYFFQLLFPFGWVNNPNQRRAAAAGGCMLVNRMALDKSGGLEMIKGEVIDDCALARLIKTPSPDIRRAIWTGLSELVRSSRRYETIEDVDAMVRRTAYSQLNHSPILLVGTVIGMVILFLIGPLTLVTVPIHGQLTAAVLGAMSWLWCAVTFVPTLALYGKPYFRLAPQLPLAAALFIRMTIDSAADYNKGKGAQWKGRTYSAAQ